VIIVRDGNMDAVHSHSLTVLVYSAGVEDMSPCRQRRKIRRLKALILANVMKIWCSSSPNGCRVTNTATIQLTAATSPIPTPKSGEKSNENPLATKAANGKMRVSAVTRALCANAPKSSRCEKETYFFT